MNTVGRLKAVLGLDSKKFNKGLKSSQKKASKFGSRMKKIGGTIAGAFAIGKLVQFGKKAVEAANQQQQAEAKLRTAIEANGKAVDETFQSHVKFASQLQKVTTVGDETTIQLIQMAEAMQSDAPQQAAQGAIALSKAYGMNLQAALKGVARAQEGDYQMLQRYIPALKTATTEAEKHAVFQKAMADGLSIAKSETQSGMGAIQQMNNAIGDLMEDIGGAMLPLLNKWADRIKTAANWIQNNKEQVKGWAKSLGTVIGVLGTARIAMLALNAAMSANPIGLIVTALATLTSAFITAWNTSEKFRAAVIYVGETIAYRFKQAWAVIEVGIENVWKTVQTYFKAIGDGAKTLWRAVKAVFTSGKSPADILKKGFSDIRKDMGDLGEDLGEQVKKKMGDAAKPDYDDILDEQQAKSSAKKTGEEAGKSFAAGMQAGMGGGGAGAGGGGRDTSTPGGQMQGLGFSGFETEKVEPQLANMDAFIQKNNEMAAALQNTGANSQVVSSIIGNAFQGMQTSLSDALANSKNVLQGFWTFFKDFIKRLIIKLVAAATAAAALFALLSLTGINVGGLSSASKFKDVFGAISGIKGMAGMANGGIVPAGYPNDSYPAMLSSGETVTPPKKLPNPNQGGGMGGELKARVSGQDLEFVLNKWSKNKNRIT